MARKYDAKKLKILNPYVRFLKDGAFAKVYYCGEVVSLSNDQVKHYYFTADEDLLAAIRDGKAIVDLASERNMMGKLIRIAELVALRDFISDEQLSRINKRLLFYASLSKPIELMWNYRKMFHVKLDAWQGTRFYRRLIYQDSFILLRFLIFMLCTIFRLILKAIVVPSYFMLNLILFPFMSFYKYVGLKLDKKRIAKRLQTEYIFEQGETKMREQLKLIDGEIGSQRKEFFEMGGNLIAILISIVAVFISVQNFKRSSELTRVNDENKELRQSALRNENEIGIQALEIRSLRDLLLRIQTSASTPSIENAGK